MFEAVASGVVTAGAAADQVGALREVLHRAHTRGLAHGAIVSGNVIVRPDLHRGRSRGLRPVGVASTSIEPGGAGLGRRHRA